MKTISYKGYQASVEFEDGMLFVKVLHIDDLLVAQCDKASDAQGALEELVEAYLEDCQEAGREPTKPFKGSFQVRLTPELHRRAAQAAAEEKLTLNAWVTDAVKEKMECDKLSERIDGVFSRSKANMLDTAALTQWMQASLSLAWEDAQHSTKVVATQWRGSENVHIFPISAKLSNRMKLNG